MIRRSSLEMSSFLEVSQLPPESVDNGNDHGGLGSEYACDAKRQKVSSLLSTLRRQLAEASTATAAAFEKSMQACYADVTEQDARLKVVAADVAPARRNPPDTAANSLGLARGLQREDHEQGDDRGQQRDDKRDFADFETRHQIASSSVRSRPKYSAFEMKCGLSPDES